MTAYHRGARNGSLAEIRAECQESRGSAGWDRIFLFCLFSSWSLPHIFHWQGGQHLATLLSPWSSPPEYSTEEERKFY